MPTYEYSCPKCGVFEHYQSMNDATLKKCPRCKKMGVKRLIGGGAGLIFKGTGFYITDYKKKSGGGGEAKSGGEKSGGETKTGGDKTSGETKSGGEKAAPAKTETKPQTKPASSS